MNPDKYISRCLDESINKCLEIFHTYDPELVKKVVTTCAGEHVNFINAYIYDMLPDKPEYTKGFWIGTLFALVGEK